MSPRRTIGQPTYGQRSDGGATLSDGLSHESIPPELLLAGSKASSQGWVRVCDGTGKVFYHGLSSGKITLERPEEFGEDNPVWADGVKKSPSLDHRMNSLNQSHRYTATDTTLSPAVWEVDSHGKLVSPHHIPSRSKLRQHSVIHDTDLDSSGVTDDTATVDHLHTLADQASGANPRKHGVEWKSHSGIRRAKGTGSIGRSLSCLIHTSRTCRDVDSIISHSGHYVAWESLVDSPKHRPFPLSLHLHLSLACQVTNFVSNFYSSRISFFPCFQGLFMMFRVVNFEL